MKFFRIHWKIDKGFYLFCRHFGNVSEIFFWKNLQKLWRIFEVVICIRKILERFRVNMEEILEKYERLGNLKKKKIF